MLSKLDFKYFYGTGLLFLVLNMVCFAFDFYFAFLLPIIPIALYFLIAHTDKVIYFLAFATPLSIPFKDIGGGLGLSIPTEPLIVFLFVGFLFKLLQGKQFEWAILKNPLIIIVSINLMWMIVTTITSSQPLVSFKYTLSYAWYAFVFLLVMAHFFKDTKRIRIFIWCLAIATSILVLYTLKNHAAEGFTRLYAYTAMRPFLPDHGMYAAAISFLIPAMFVMGVFGKKMGSNWFWITVALGLFVIITLGVIFSFTRASWLSLVVAYGVFFLLMFKVQFKTLITTGLIVLGLFFLFQNTILMELSRNKQDSDDDIEAHVQSFSNVSTDPSNLERLNRWSSALRMFQERPFFGFGPGTYTYEYAPFQLSSEMTIISTNAGDQGNVHSEYFRPFAESGVIGGVLYVLLVLITIWQGFHVYYQGESNEVRGLSLAVLLGLITYFVHGLLNNYSDFDKIAVPMWSFMAAIVSLKTYHMAQKEQKEKAIN